MTKAKLKLNINGWILTTITLLVMAYSTVENVGWLKTLLCVWLNVTGITIIIILIMAICIILFVPTSKEMCVNINDTLKHGILMKIWSWIYRGIVLTFTISNGFVGTSIVFIFGIIIYYCFKYVFNKFVKVNGVK